MSASRALCCVACERGVAPGCIVLQQTATGRQLCCPHSLLLVGDRTHTARVLTTGPMDFASGAYCPFCEEEGAVVLGFDALGWAACMRCLAAFHDELGPPACLGTNCERPHRVVLPQGGLRRSRARLVCGDCEQISILSDAWRSLVVVGDRSYSGFLEMFNPVGALNAATCSHAQQSIRALLRRMNLGETRADMSDGEQSDGTSVMDYE